MRTQITKQILYGTTICFIAACFYCYEFILRIFPGALQLELMQAFGNISASLFGQISALYYFAYSPMQLPVGMLMDKYGPRLLLTLSCFLCAFGAFCFTFTSSISLAGAGRFLMGFGSAFAFVGVLSLAIRWFPRQYFSLVAGLITTLGMLGLVYGEIKITTLAHQLGWHVVMEILVVIGMVLACCLFFIVRDAPKGAVYRPEKTQHFMQKVWRVLISPQIWLIGCVGACLYTSLSVFGELWGKAYLQKAHHLTDFQAAQGISCIFLGWAIGAPIAGYYSDKTRQRMLPLVVGAFVSLIAIGFILYYPNLSPTALMLLLFIYGLFSATEIIVFIMGKESSGAELSGTVFAAINMIVTLGGVFFQPLVGWLLDFVAKSPLFAPHTEVLNYQIALSIIPISLMAVLILVIFIRKPYENTAQKS